MGAGGSLTGNGALLADPKDARMPVQPVSLVIFPLFVTWLPHSFSRWAGVCIESVLTALEHPTCHIVTCVQIFIKVATTKA